MEHPALSMKTSHAMSKQELQVTANQGIQQAPNDLTGPRLPTAPMG